MKSLNDYIVPIVGTKDGLHQFDFSIDASFLKQYNYSDIVDILAKVHVNFYKSNRLFDISISMKGEIKVECDRCLDEFMMPVSFEHHLVVKAEDNSSDSEEEVVFIPEASTEIDLAPYVFETIVFSIPMRKVHPLDSDGNSLCNKEMISKLNKYLINESNTDPRWDSLKEMLN
ncbi:MAG TPA: DUF177 domain-containing protein [Bacteroidales bacterium]|nr:DUF177 domain-containing protein [Bacteroidales bacterium]HOU98913.1 DUF177 domain-containing protein [Bacteroidales bacterium]